MDVLYVDDLMSQVDLDFALASLAPSFNVSQGADAAMLMRPGSLRGLAPDATLVMVNGKRRHRGAVVALLGYGIANGAQGVDLAAIPMSAVERVEISPRRGVCPIRIGRRGRGHEHSLEPASPEAR